MNPIEIIASLLGVVSVWFSVKRNIWVFPIGIVMVILYIVVFYQARLYSDMLLQVVYVFMQLHGWFEWSRGDRADDEKIAIGRLSLFQWGASGVVQVAGTIALGYTMSRFTDAALPWLDAFTTVMSLIAQWWVNKKYLENWVLWMLVDLIYLYQYTVKGLYLTTGLYFVFFILAILGYREWRKKSNLFVTHSY
jgi:nicotinamide mononucleotide transporter